MEPREILSLLRPKTAQRFQARLKQEGECIVFTGCKHKQGYGVVDVMTDGVRTPILTHRLAWALAHGVDPPSELRVLHRCNNPPCCNPAHLYIGTAQDNADDYRAAGRHRGGMKGRTGVAHPAAHPKELRDHVLGIIREDISLGRGVNFWRTRKATGVHNDTISRWWKEAGCK